MRGLCAGQAEYVWTCFVISSFILASQVDSQPSLIKTPASDVTASQWQTTRATFVQEQTNSSTLDQGQKNSTTLDQGQTNSTTLDQGQTNSTTFVQGQTVSTTLDQGQTNSTTLDQRQTNSTTLDHGQTTRATLDQGQTIIIIKGKNTSVAWQYFPLVTSENDGDANSSSNITSRSNPGNKDKHRTDDSNQKSDDDDISIDDKKYNVQGNDINVHVHDNSGGVFGDSNFNNNETPNNNSNNNNNNNDSSNNTDYFSRDCTNPFYSHGLKKRSSNNKDDNSNTTSYDNHNDNGDFPLYDNYKHNNITRDIKNISTVHGQTDNHTIKPTNSTSNTFYILSGLEEIYFSLTWYTTLVLKPFFGLLGLTGNILSGIVAKRSGLNKSTNIFILALALADSFTLIDSINVPTYLRYFPNYFPWYYLVWEYSPSLAYLCFILTVITEFVLRISGYYISGYICTLITIERVLAVYYPMKFKSIMSPLRAWILVVSMFLFWTSYTTFCAAMLDRLQISYIPSVNIHVGAWTRKNSVLIDIDGYFFTPMGKFFPVIVTVAGSILIGVKVRNAGRKRKTMTSISKTSKSGSRTTKTLMSVCGVFIVSQCVVLPFMVFQFAYKGQEVYIKGICSILFYIVQSINGSCNFIIYVVVNSKFRSELKRMFPCFGKYLKKDNGTRSTFCRSTNTSQLQ